MSTVFAKVNLVLHVQSHLWPILFAGAIVDLRLEMISLRSVKSVSESFSLVNHIDDASWETPEVVCCDFVWAGAVVYSRLSV